jgi:hypothetical protein
VLDPGSVGMPKLAAEPKHPVAELLAPGIVQQLGSKTLLKPRQALVTGGWVRVGCARLLAGHLEVTLLMVKARRVLACRRTRRAVSMSEGIVLLPELTVKLWSSKGSNPSLFMVGCGRSAG